MELKLPKERAQQLGFKKLEQFGMNERSWNYKGQGSLDLRKLSTPQLKALRELLESNKTVHGVKMMLYDLGCYERAMSDPNSVKIRNIRTFPVLLQGYLKNLPNHHLYKKDPDNENIRLPYYVNKITYHPKERSRYGTTPAKVTMDLMWQQFEGRTASTVTWHKQDVRDKTIAQILTIAGYYLEDDDLRKQYESDLIKWDTAVGKLGKQYLASGQGISETSESYWRSRQQVHLGTDEDPAKVVVDVFFEGDHKPEKNAIVIDTDFWGKKVDVAKDDEEIPDEDDDDDLEDEEEVEGRVVGISARGEVPIHPYLMVFDLRKHLRLKVHVNNLTEYKYDKKIAEKLILPRESKHLVHILVEHRDGGFKDIVKGKGGGAIVLLSGPPGTGKTLTAEVFAESEERPLYSVQASQLGTDEEELEKELMLVLQRGKRWNAVMLIDEADVYVHSRGSDLRQNAIVGVFLRVLEYHAGVLFLTTNRADLVDDAIASRCVARINYKVPPVEDQKKIWQVLSEGSDIKIMDLDLIVSENSKLSGRDIKNLLKLARLYVASGDAKAVTAEVVRFVRQFKPTEDVK